MKRELYLHIGLPKTGTTYLQCQIQNNREKLRSNGIYVPKIGQLVGLDHNLLALALQPERWHQFSYDISASLPSMWHDLLEEIDNCGCQTILVTSEVFSWELKTPEQIKSVRDYFANYDVRIVFCERNSYDFISSMYGHLIKTGRGPYPLDSFLLEFPYYWSTAYQRKRWSNFFGDNNFIVLSYEDLRGEFIFFEFLKKLFPSHAILSVCFDFAPDADLNQSYSPRFLKFMEELSANQIDSAPYVSLYSKILGTIIPLEHQMLKPADIDEAMTRCGMKLDSSNSTANKMTHQREQKEVNVPNLERISTDLMERTRELVETRQLLRERSEMLDRLNVELAGKTKNIFKMWLGVPFFLKGMKKLFTAPLRDRRNIMEVLGEINQVSNQNLNLMSILEERSRTIEHLANQNLNLMSIAEERSRTIEHLANQNLSLMSTTEERSRTIEHLANQNLSLMSTTEERSRTIEYVANQNLFSAQYQIDFSQKKYIESMLGVMPFEKSPWFNARQVIALKTDYSLASTSNDYINPESTMEGIVRPTFFVRNCIELLGQEIKCLDLGAGSAGLVFEYAMNGIFAVGVDGSDFCNRYKIGYWPLLVNNLFNCDITKPFSFKSIQNNTNYYFNIITMWEVLEHIEEDDLNGLFRNINEHLSPNGYFIGSISLLEYVDKNGRPYHVTLKSKKWWADKFQENGLVMLETHPFNKEFFCRGVGSRFQDAHNYLLYPEEGFHFVAIKSNGNFDSLALQS